MGNWIEQFFSQGSIALTIVMFSITIVGGFMLNKIKIKGISLGVTWILFVGLAIGHLDCCSIDGNVMVFVKEFGLILFVYAIGSQCGSSFFSSLRHGGLQMNMLALGLVLLNVAVTICVALLSHTDWANAVGLMSGAVTNTPGLGAAQQTYTDITGKSSAFIAAGYAITYPMGVIGVIMVFILLQKFSNSTSEPTTTKEETLLDIFTLEIQNAQCIGKALGDIKAALKVNFVVTRLYHTSAQSMEVPNNSSILYEGDRIYVIAAKDDARAVELCIGNRIDMDLNSWDKLDTQLICKKLTVSKSDINGKSLSSLDFRNAFNVNISRVIRSGFSLVPSQELKLQVGDTLVAVGDEISIQKLGIFLGNSPKKLNDPYLIPIFLGIAIGVLLGSIPFTIPGIPQPVKLGLAGGPLIVAILLNRFGTQLRIVTYATSSALRMLQELGITLFLAAVGLSSGKIFWETLMEHGATWFLYGSIITIVPVAIITIIGKLILKLDTRQIMGLISGASTNPAALAFANSTDETGKVAVSYATVYPLSMLLRIMAAQCMILFLL